MKRAREDVCTSSQLKRPETIVSYRGETSAQPHMTNGGTSSSSTAQKLTRDDALAYLKDLKQMLHGKKEKYEEFLEVMKDFKAQRIDTAGVIARVKELLKGYPNLILGFNTFLPKGYEITLPFPEIAVKQPAEYSEAINFVNKIKMRFQGDEYDHVYKSFLDILNLYRRETKSIAEVYKDVEVLFKDHDDLLVEFENFLPDNSRQAFGRTSIFRDKDSSVPPIRQMHVDRKDKNKTSHAKQHLTGDHSDPNCDKSAMRTNKDSQKCEKNGDMTEPKIDAREYDRNDGKNLNYTNRIPISEAADGREHSIADQRDDNGAPKRSVYREEFAYCDKVKDKFQNSNGYQEFLKLLDLYSREVINREELHGLVHELLGKYSDLIEGFDEFLARCEKIDVFLADLNKKEIKKGVLLEQPKDEGRNTDKFRERDDRDRNRDRGSKESADSIMYRPSIPFNKEFIGKTIQELDLSDCEQSTPSYRLLPNNYPIPEVSQRTELGAAVLNDHWVSVTSGSEDYSFKHMRKNQYEESLFRCEDDMFELDMLLESVITTVKRVEGILDKKNNNNNKIDIPVRIEEYFTARSLRCIELIYGDHGLDIIDLLKKNTTLALPVILTRLKQKQEEWSRCRADFNKGWAKIYAKNHHRSLDHRSFYFKQHDTKSLSTKALLSEIEKISGQNRNNDDVLLAVAAGNKQPIVPHMEFSYVDPGIHEDLYHLVKYSCGEVCTSEQLDKVMNIWSTILESVLGVPTRPREDMNIEDQVSKRSGIIATESHKIADGSANETTSNSVQHNTVLACASSIAEKSPGCSTSPTKNCNGTVDNVHEMRPSAGSLHLVEAADSSRPVISNDVVPEASTDHIQQEGSDAQSEVEREEGELSPIRDFGEDNFAVYVDANAEVDNKPNGADDEGRHRSSESENGDVSNSRSLEHEEDGEANGALLSFSRRIERKPLAKHVSSTVVGKTKDSRVFYGDDSLYVLFRLHQILYERILSAKKNSASAERRWKSSNETVSSDHYSRFMNALYNLLDGTSDNSKFEDDCRAIIGTQSYLLFTLDKLIYKLVKQLQTVADDETSSTLLELYAYENCRTPARFSDTVYWENARALFLDDNIYRIECQTGSPTRLSIQLMENVQDKPEIASASMESDFLSYLQNEFLTNAPCEPGTSVIFLKRNQQKRSTDDDSLDGFEISNGLECKIASSTSKVSYVFDTEDFLLWKARKSKSVNSSNKQEFHATSKKEILRIERYRCLFPSS